MRRLAASAVAAGLLLLLATGAADAHGSRDVGAYRIVVGFINEPVAVGQRSGLELRVTRDGVPVEGVAATLTAAVLYGDRTLELPLAPGAGAAGWYESAFTPTAAGQYTFHLTGTIEATPIDEAFTSGKDGFDNVGEVAGGQFPNELPSITGVADDATRAAEAAARMPLAIGLGALGAVSGLLALGVALAGRRGRG